MLLVDTNVWLTSVDRCARHHTVCRHLLAARRGQLAAPVPVIAETSWMILERLGPSAQARFVRLVTEGHLQVVELTSDDWARCLDLVTSYANLRLDLMDASLVAVAERLVIELASFNGRDFHTVRPRHTDAFTLLPAGLTPT